MFANIKLSYFGDLCRDHGCQITKTVVEGYVDGMRRRRRPRKQYMDNIKQWTQMTTSHSAYGLQKTAVAGRPTIKHYPSTSC